MTYTEKKRFEAVVKFTKRFSYTRPSYAGYGYDTVDIYKMEDSEGNVLVWKTTGSLMYDPTGRSDDWQFPNQGAKIRIKATVKGFGEYNGEKQVNINRVKVLEIVEQTMSWEEKQEAKKNSKLESLKEGDEVWAVTYKQYKEHYSDCETVTGSYRVENGVAMISIIVREGRMKKSGTRFQHYSGYQFINENGEKVTYRAVSEENALKRCKKEFPENTWALNHVFDYGSRYEANMGVEYGYTEPQQEEKKSGSDAWEGFEIFWEYVNAE